MAWIFYAIIGVLFFSSTNYIEKFIVDKKIKEPLILTITCGPVFLVLGLCMFFFIRIHPVTIFQLAALIFAGIFLMLYLMPYYEALKFEETSRLIPLFEFVPVFTLLFSFFFLGEHLKIVEYIGFFLILAGGIGVSIKKLDFGILTLGKPFFLMLFSSLLYSAVPILFKYAVVSVDFWTAFFYQSIGAFIGTLLLLIYPPHQKIFRKYIKKVPAFPTIMLFITHGLGFVGELFLSFAYFLAPVALVTVVVGTQPFFVLLIGIILSLWFPHIVEEDIKKSTLIIKFVAILLIFAGTLFIQR